MAAESTGSGVVDILVQRGVITREMLARVSSQETGPIEKRLLQSQMVSQDDMTLAMAEYVRMPPIKLAHFVADHNLLELQPKDAWEHTRSFPMWKNGKTLLVALADPFDIHLIENLRMLTGMTIVPMVAAEIHASKNFSGVVAARPLMVVRLQCWKPDTRVVPGRSPL